MDPDQTARYVHCLTKLLQQQFSRHQKQTTFVVIGALRVNHVIIVLQRRDTGK